MKTFIKKPIVLIPLLLLAGGVLGGYALLNGAGNPLYDFVVAERSNLVQQVSITGRVHPAQNVELAFEKGGRVLSVYTKVGDSVGAGQTLVELESSELQAQLLGQEAALETERAKLAELERGTRPEEIKVQEVRVENAQIALATSQNNLLDALKNAYTGADDAIRNNVDLLYTNPTSDTPELKFSPKSVLAENDLEWERLLIENMLVLWEKHIASLTMESDFDSFTDEAEKNLKTLKDFLFDELTLAVNELTPSTRITQATITGWQANMADARTTIEGARGDVSSKKEKFQDAKSILALEREELVLLKAGSALEQLAAQKAQVKNAEASVQNYQAQIAKTKLRSPLTGVITQQDAKIGEIVAANTVLVSIISPAKFQIETNIPEADIAKVALGNPAQITLDAYGRDTLFEAVVTEIDPGETILEGVPTYKVTLQFTRDDARIKSGMTANIEITSDSRENVLVIPQRSLIRKNGDKFVRLLRGEEVVEVEVEVGLQGSDGNIEITQGIEEGEKVITFFPE